MERALHDFEHALSAWQRSGDKKKESYCLVYMDKIYYRGGQYTKALEYDEKGLAIHAQVGDVKEGTTLSNIAHVLMPMGYHDQAIADLRKTLDTYIRIATPTERVRDSMAQVYLEK